MLHLNCAFGFWRAISIHQVQVVVGWSVSLCAAADVSRFLQISKNKKEKLTCVESGVGDI